MLEDVDGQLVQIRESGLADLLSVVIEQFELHCQMAKEMYKEFGCIPDIKIQQENGYDARNSAIISQTFTAMIIEAFYFDYYFGKNSKTKAEKWSKQSPMKQFEQLCVNYLNQPEFESLDLHIKLKELNKVRKRWVHNQSTEIGKYRKDLGYLSADGCIQLLREFFEYFHTKDTSCKLAEFTHSVLTELQLNTKGYNGL
jgi:hypothetical protein